MIVAKRLILSIWAKSWILAKSPSEQVLPGRRGQPHVAFGRLASLFQTIQYLGVAAMKTGFCTPIPAVVQPWDESAQFFGQHPDICRAVCSSLFLFSLVKMLPKSWVVPWRGARRNEILLHWGSLWPIGDGDRAGCSPTETSSIQLLSEGGYAEIGTTSPAWMSTYRIYAGYINSLPHPTAKMLMRYLLLYHLGPTFMWLSSSSWSPCYQCISKSCICVLMNPIPTAHDIHICCGLRRGKLKCIVDKSPQGISFFLN